MPRRSTIIAICTFNRNNSLKLLLGDLERQIQVAELPQIYIIDNSPNGVAQTLITKLGQSNKNLNYCQELQSGVAFARNRAIGLATRQGADLIFLDDDERVSETWLSNLKKSSMKFPKSIIAGPVIPIVDPALSSWCPNQKCWQRPIWPDGANIKSAVGTGNVLIPIEALDALGGFQTDLNSGGEDTEFTERWLRLRGEIRFSRGAEASELVVQERLQPDYVRARLERSTYIWASLQAQNIFQRILLITRLPLYLFQGIFRYLTNPHQGSRSAHQNIYFAKFRGMKRFICTLEFLGHHQKDGSRGKSSR